MSTLSVDTIQGQTTASKVMIPGHVVQIVEGTRTDSTNTASSTYSDAGLSVINYKFLQQTVRFLFLSPVGSVTLVVVQIIM